MDDSTDEFVLNFDGSCKFNNQSIHKRIGGSAAVIFKNDVEISYISKILHNNSSFIITNNYAEYYALIIGLEKALELNIKKIKVKGDSLLVINQINNIFKVKSDNLIPLFNKIKELQAKFEHISFEHVFRKFNKRADQLANLVLN
jgi:ribonuclease HI